MLLLAYHCGALGHSTLALIECCTKEGGGTLPSFFEGNNLHHYVPLQTLVRFKHPLCDIKHEQLCGNKVISSTSSTLFGRFLVIVMSINKWSLKEPKFDCPGEYKQYGKSYGEQIEILSVTLLDKVKSDSDWFMDADYILDITDYWNNPDNVTQFLGRCGFTPDYKKVLEFCNQVALANQQYYDLVKKCEDVVYSVLHKIECAVELSFLECALCHAMLLNHFNLDHSGTKLLQKPPTSTKDLMGIFDT